MLNADLVAGSISRLSNVCLRIQIVTERCRQIWNTSSTYQGKKIRPYHHVSGNNLRVLAEETLYGHQQQFSTNMRAEIVGDCSVGPHVLPHRLTGNQY
jgi:hypothetical protein